MILVGPNWKQACPWILALMSHRYVSLNIYILRWTRNGDKLHSCMSFYSILHNVLCLVLSNEHFSNWTNPARMTPNSGKCNGIYQHWKRKWYLEIWDLFCLIRPIYIFFGSIVEIPCNRHLHNARHRDKLEMWSIGTTWLIHPRFDKHQCLIILCAQRVDQNRYHNHKQP